MKFDSRKAIRSLLYSLIVSVSVFLYYFLYLVGARCWDSWKELPAYFLRHCLGIPVTAYAYFSDVSVSSFILSTFGFVIVFCWSVFLFIGTVELIKQIKKFL